jgi:hypothetical protein
MNETAWSGTRPGLRRIARLQAAYYVVTGIWPLASRRSFEAVTGPKRDFWLVQVVGALVTVIGASLFAASRRSGGAETGAVQVLAVGSAAALAVADVAFVARRRISRIYLADAASEAILAVGWVMARRDASPPVDRVAGSRDG